MFKFIKKLFKRRKKNVNVESKIKADDIAINSNITTVHHKILNLEYWKDYDEKGRIVHYKDSAGFEYWKEYDDENNTLHYKNNRGYEFIEKYDEKGRIVHYKDCRTNYEESFKYMDKTEIIHFRDGNGFEKYIPYN